MSTKTITLATANGSNLLCVNRLIDGQEPLSRKLEFQKDFTQFTVLDQCKGKSWVSLLEPHLAQDSIAADILDGHRRDITIEGFWTAFLASGHKVSKPRPFKL